MRLSDIVSMGIDYILVGIVALLFVGTVFSLWYFLWFKKRRNSCSRIERSEFYRKLC